MKKKCEKEYSPINYFLQFEREWRRLRAINEDVQELIFQNLNVLEPDKE